MTAVGVVMSSDFSGEDCPETAWRLMETELKAAGTIPATTPAMQSYRACDNDHLCQRILNSNHRPCHISKYVFDRVPPPAHTHIAPMLQDIAPGKRGSEADRERAACLDIIHNYFRRKINRHNTRHALAIWRRDCPILMKV